MSSSVPARTVRLVTAGEALFYRVHTVSSGCGLVHKKTGPNREGACKNPRFRDILEET